MSEFEIGVQAAAAAAAGGEDDIEIDLEHMFDTIPPDDLYILDDGNNSSSSYSSSFVPDPSRSAPDASFSMIEEFLFNDDYSGDPTIHPHLLSAADGFLSDILLDSPLPLDSSSSSSSFSGADRLSPEIDPLNSNHEAKDSEEEQQQEANLRHHQLPPPPADEAELAGEENPHIDNINNDDADDPIIAKKRKRQLRNRDAAVRSRERKKMYVKDLEMKSRYYEAECRRLGMLLQCYLAENHALRLSLHNNGQAFDASTTKQESAVLLLESLLLGSLLWFLGIIGLFILPGVENVGHKDPGSLALGKARSNVFGTLEVVPSFMMSKRCRGSRRKMRCSIEVGLRGSLDVFSSFLSMTSFS